MADGGTLMPPSSRLTHKQKVLALLSDGLPHSHMEGYRLGVMLHSRAADLRKDGYDIQVCRDGDDYVYRLVSGPLDEALNGREGSAAPSTVSVSSSGADIPAADGITADPHGTAPYVQLELGAAA